MRNYEVMFILKPDLEEEVIAKFIDRYSAIITDGGGELVSVDKWGKRRLAYEINDLQEGYYVLITFKSEPAVVAELDRVMKIADEMMRFMIINKDEKYNTTKLNILKYVKASHPGGLGYSGLFTGLNALLNPGLRLCFLPSMPVSVKLL